MGLQGIGKSVSPALDETEREALERSAGVLKKSLESIAYAFAREIAKRIGKKLELRETDHCLIFNDLKPGPQTDRLLAFPEELFQFYCRIFEVQEGDLCHRGKLLVFLWSQREGFEKLAVSLENIPRVRASERHQRQDGLSRGDGSGRVEHFAGDRADHLDARGRPSGRATNRNHGRCGRAGDRPRGATDDPGLEIDAPRAASSVRNTLKSYAVTLVLLFVV